MSIFFSMIQNSISYRKVGSSNKVNDYYSNLKGDFQIMFVVVTGGLLFLITDTLKTLELQLKPNTREYFVPSLRQPKNLLFF